MLESKAISETQEMWKGIEKSGLGKFDFLKTPEGRVWVDKDYKCNCPLCEYSGSLLYGCPRCPLVKQYDKGCYDLGYKESGVSSPEFFNAVRGLK